jgi:hypothetical protein
MAEENGVSSLLWVFLIARSNTCENSHQNDGCWTESGNGHAVMYSRSECVGCDEVLANIAV